MFVECVNKMRYLNEYLLVWLKYFVIWLVIVNDKVLKLLAYPIFYLFCMSSFYMWWSCVTQKQIML